MDGIRPLTNLLFKRYTVIRIDTPPLPQNKQDPPPPLSPNKIQSNKRKQNTRHIFKINMRDANLLLFISVHVCVGRGGGGNKAYTLQKLISTHIFILKL